MERSENLQNLFCTKYPLLRLEIGIGKYEWNGTKHRSWNIVTVLKEKFGIDADVWGCDDMAHEIRSMIIDLIMWMFCLKYSNLVISNICRYAKSKHIVICD